MRASSAAKNCVTAGTSDMEQLLLADSKRIVASERVPSQAISGSPFVEVEGESMSTSGDPVEPLRGAVHHRSRGYRIGLRFYGDLSRALGDQHDLFFGVLMRRMRHHAGLQDQTSNS